MFAYLDGQMISIQSEEPDLKTEGSAGPAGLYGQNGRSRESHLTLTLPMITEFFFFSASVRYRHVGPMVFQPRAWIRLRQHHSSCMALSLEAIALSIKVGSERGETNTQSALVMISELSLATRLHAPEIGEAGTPRLEERRTC
jgi:hypothetical protein